VPPRHPSIAHALGSCRRQLGALCSGPGRAAGVGVHVACSGGADSVTLLGLLCLLAPRERWRLSVGHVDHGLRPTSADEAALVQRLAAARGLACEVERLALAHGPGLPARARQARRAALREQARRQGAAFVALGHTATDQAETMLLHLARGAGLPGLAAMAAHEPWDEGVAVDPLGPRGGWLRPLLALDRAQTRALAERLGLPFVDDPTNLDHRHPRVRMRHEILPVLRQLNPQVEAALARTSAHARQAEDALQQWVDHELGARRRSPVAPGDGPPPSDALLPGDVPQHPDAPPRVTSSPRWSTEGMHLVPAAVRTRMVWRVCRAAGVPADALAARTLAAIDHALTHPGESRVFELHPCVRLHIAHGEIWTSPVPRAPNH
jgi:tRNA(Ile)-lysidine synthase